MYVLYVHMCIEYIHNVYDYMYAMYVLQYIGHEVHLNIKSLKLELLGQKW